MPLVSGLLSAKEALSLDWKSEVVRELSAVWTDYFLFPLSGLLYGQILGIGHQGNNLFLGGMLFCLAGVGMIAVFKGWFLTVGDVPGKHTALMFRRVLTPLQKCSIFYVSMAFVAFLLSLGMVLTPIHTKGLGVYRLLVWLSPYNLLYEFVPGFSSVRSPYRFSIFLGLFLAILAGIGMLWLYRRFRSRWRWGIIMGVMLVAVFELWPIPLRLVKVESKLEELPHIYRQVKTLPADTVLIEFPLATSRSYRGLESIARYMYFSTFHWHQLVDGYSGFMPESLEEFMDMLRKSSVQFAFSAFKAFGIQYVVAHWNEMSDAEKVLLQALEVRGHLKPVFCERNRSTLYQVDNSQHKSLKTKIPNVERIEIYESEQFRRVVTLCFYYEMKKDAVLLVTPWKNLVECEVFWYESSVPSQIRPPILVKKVAYRGSQLLHADSNALAMDVPMPGPGRYQVVIKHRLASHSITKSGFCEIYPHGFVRFSEDP